MKHIVPICSASFAAKNRKREKLMRASKVNSGIVCDIIQLKHKSRLTFFECPFIVWLTCTYLDRIFWITFFTHGAWGSRQTSWSVFFRVALQRQARNGHAVRTSDSDKISSVNIITVIRWDEGFEIWSYMISVSSQWELGGISSTLAMWRAMNLLSVWMQRQCSSTPRLLRLIPVRRQKSHFEVSMHWIKRTAKCARVMTV